MAKKVHTSEQITAFLTELENQTDRGAALIAGAVLDEVLEMLISARLLDVGRERHEALFGRGKPMDSFSAKIELGYQLGLYTNAMRIQLEMIREVRNRFAHRIESLQFSNPKIAEILRSRQTPNMPKGQAARAHFMGVFGAVAAMLYGTLAADVRLASLGETHGDHFVRMAEAIARREAEARGKRQPRPDTEPSSDPSTP